jgi:hypothetical protein
MGRGLLDNELRPLFSLDFRGGTAIASIAFRGVLAADIPGGPAAGTVLELDGESEFGFAGGRISRIIDRS